MSPLQTLKGFLGLNSLRCSLYADSCPAVTVAKDGGNLQITRQKSLNQYNIQTRMDKSLYIYFLNLFERAAIILNGLRNVNVHSQLGEQTLCNMNLCPAEHANKDLTHFRRLK